MCAVDANVCVCVCVYGKVVHWGVNRPATMQESEVDSEVDLTPRHSSWDPESLVSLGRKRWEGNWYIRKQARMGCLGYFVCLQTNAEEH